MVIISPICPNAAADMHSTTNPNKTVRMKRILILFPLARRPSFARYVYPRVSWSRSRVITHQRVTAARPQPSRFSTADSTHYADRSAHPECRPECSLPLHFDLVQNLLNIRHAHCGRLCLLALFGSLDAAF